MKTQQNCSKQTREYSSVIYLVPYFLDEIACRTKVKIYEHFIRYKQLKPVHVDEFLIDDALILNVKRELITNVGRSINTTRS